MSVIVSDCLLGTKCKYNGGDNLNLQVIKFLEGKHVIPVCPEVMGGMSTPRLCAEIQNGKIVDSKGQCVHDKYDAGVQAVMSSIQGQAIECAILMSRSPTCGVKQIYDGTFTGQLIDGQGILAKALMEAGYKVMDASEF